MAETNDKTSTTNDRPADAAASATATRENSDGSGCGVLFLIAILVVDTLGVLVPATGPHADVVTILGFVGFAFGAVLGAYVSVKIKKTHWWSSCRWAIYGLLVACLFTCAAAYLSIAIRTMR